MCPNAMLLLPMRQMDPMEYWESRWSRADFDPMWRVKTIPAEIQEAVKDSWF